MAWFLYGWLMNTTLETFLTVLVLFQRFHDDTLHLQRHGVDGCDRVPQSALCWGNTGFIESGLYDATHPVNLWYFQNLLLLQVQTRSHACF